MKYDDLLNIPFKKFGRDKNGFDCYGVVIECCKRAGTPLKDLYGDIVDLPADKVNDYISGGLNVKEIPAPKVGGLVYSIYKNNVHVGYIVERDKSFTRHNRQGRKNLTISSIKTNRIL